MTSASQNVTATARTNGYEMELLEPKNGYVYRVRVLSDSGKAYVVAMKADGTWACSCPAWIFQRGGERKECKHIAAVQDRNGALLGDEQTTLDSAVTA